MGREDIKQVLLQGYESNRVIEAIRKLLEAKVKIDTINEIEAEILAEGYYAP